MSNSPPNRKRNKTLTIQLTPEEWTKLMEGTLHAGMNVTEYLLSLSDSVVINPPPDLSPLLTQLKRIGNNLNQIAAKVNAGVAYVPGLKEVAALQRELLEELRRMTKEGPWQPQPTSRSKSKAPATWPASSPTAPRN